MTSSANHFIEKVSIALLSLVTSLMSLITTLMPLVTYLMPLVTHFLPTDPGPHCERCQDQRLTVTPMGAVHGAVYAALASAQCSVQCIVV